MNSAQVKRFDAVSMDKLSPKSPLIYEKYKSGCAWYLIGLCDFSQGHSNKELISNRGRSNSTNVVGLVRKEEMATRKNDMPKNHRRKANKTLHRHGCKDISTVVHTQHSYENSVGTSSKKFNGAALTEKSCNEVPPKRGKVCSGRVSSHKNNHLSEINLQVQMSEAAQAFINQKIIKGKFHGSDQASNQSKHFLNALEILNSNKELFIKLLHDPNSLLVKRIQDLHDSEATNQESDRYPSKESVDPLPSNRSLLLKSGSSGSTYVQNSAGEFGDFSSPQSLDSLRHRAQSGKPAYFSFEHMKRKLRHAIGLSRKEKSLLSTVTLDKSSRDNQGSGDGKKENDLGIIRTNSPHKINLDSVNKKKSDKVRKVNDFDSGSLNVGPSHENSKLSIVGQPKQTKLNIHMNSTKHLPEVLRNRKEVLLRKQFPGTLERIISLPEYYFSAPSLGGHWVPSSIAGQTRFSSFSNYQMVTEKRKMLQGENKNSHLNSPRQIAGIPSRADNKRLTNQSQACDTKSNICQNHLADTKFHENGSSAQYTLSSIGSMKLVETYNTIRAREISSLAALEANGLDHTNANQNVVIADTVEENSLQCSKLPVEGCASASPKDVYGSSPSSSKSLENSAATKDEADRSPVSVLEKFDEDITSPPGIISQPDRFSGAELAVEPKHNSYKDQCSAAAVMSLTDQKIHSSNVMNEHEPLCKFMRAVLQASRLNWDKLSLKYHSSGQLLEPSLFDQVEVLPNQSCGDHMLLFDYINEVLGDLCQSYFSCSPWLSFAKQIQAAKDIVYEMMKHVDWNLFRQQSSPTMDQLVEKDLARPAIWMNIRIEAEDTVCEMVESLLEELMLETAIQLSI